ncbi:MAG TPA: hypothetical protein VGO62_19320 [Myxococcota bacterium]|jgi:hypothetical protein
MRARITHRTSLFYDEGADPSLDRPAHVRAGSGLAFVNTPSGPRLLVIQDDASFLALVDVRAHPARVTSSIALPAGPNGKRTFDEASGTKKHKLDLESVTVLPGSDGPLVIALGSGSTDQRERIVVARVDQAPPAVELVHAHALYASLRAHPILREAVPGGAELNLEGVAHVGPRVMLFQRGNGVGAVNAVFALDTRAFLAFLHGGQAPAILDAREFHLGTVPSPFGTDNVALTFTDAFAHDGRVLVVAAAEASPNAVDDGEIVGCAFGVLGADLAPILDESGAIYVGKPEGLAVDEHDPTRGYLVVDKDDPSVAAELLTIRIDA